MVSQNEIRIFRMVPGSLMVSQNEIRIFRMVWEPNGVSE